MNLNLKRYLLGLLLLLGGSLAAVAQNSGDGYNPDNPQEPSTPSKLRSYVVTLQNSMDGAGALAGAGVYKYGTNVTIKATANTGYKFLYWQKGDAAEPYNTNAQFTYNVAVGDVRFTAVYEKLKKVTASVNNSAAGTASVSGGGLFATGTTATLTATPSSNFYTFLYWTKDGASEPFSTEKSITYEVGDEDAEFCAVFDCPPQVSVLVNDNAAGTAKYTYNSNVVGTEPANRTNTAGTGTSTSYSYPFCNYYKYSTTQSVYTKAELGGKGTIKSIAYYVGTASSLSSTVKIYMGHRSSASFSNATDYARASDLTLVYSGTPTLGRATGWETFTLNTPFEYNGTSNLVVVVTKSSSSTNSTLKYRYSSVSNACLYRGNSSTTGYADVSNSSSYTRTSYRPNAQFGIEYEKDVYGTARSATLTATPNTKYRLVHWLRNDETEPYTTEPSFVYELDDDVKFTAVFRWNPDNPNEPSEMEKLTKHEVKVAVNDNAAGIVSGGGKYLYNKSVTISTSPNAGYRFLHWLKDDEETPYKTTASFTYTMGVEDVSFKAVYEAIPPPVVPDSHKLNLVPGIQGSCTFSMASGTSIQEGSSFSVTVTPGPEHVFRGWYQDGVLVATTLTYSSTMGTEDITLVALCEYVPENPDDPSNPGGFVPNIVRRGDVNGDGRVSVADVTTLIAILGGAADTHGTADVDGDQDVDLADLDMLIAIIMSSK